MLYSSFYLFFSSFYFYLQMFLSYLGRVKTSWNHVIQDLVLGKKLIISFRTMKKLISDQLSYKGNYKSWIKYNKRKQNKIIFEGTQEQPKQSGFERPMSQKEGNHREVSAQDRPPQRRSIRPQISVIMSVRTPEVEPCWRISIL